MHHERRCSLWRRKSSPDKHDYSHFGDVLLDDFPGLFDELDVIRSESRWSFVLSVSALCCSRCQSGSRDRAAHPDSSTAPSALRWTAAGQLSVSLAVWVALLLHNCPESDLQRETENLRPAQQEGRSPSSSSASASSKTTCKRFFVLLNYSINEKIIDMQKYIPINIELWTHNNELYNFTSIYENIQSYN